jgi:hypothetical protein
VLCRKFCGGFSPPKDNEVDIVPGGVAGLEMLRQRRPFVGVLNLPYAESGDLCRKIANLISGFPLVILSASPDVAQSPSLGNGCRRLVTHTVQRPSALVERMPMRSRSHINPESLHVFEGGTTDFSN